MNEADQVKALDAGQIIWAAGDKGYCEAWKGRATNEYYTRLDRYMETVAGLHCSTASQCVQAFKSLCQQAEALE